MDTQPEHQSHLTKLGPPFKQPGRLQELWNALVPAKEIARELGFYSARNVCRSVRAMRKLGYDFIHRSAGRPKRDGTQRVWQMTPKDPTEAQLRYWGQVSSLMTQLHAARREEREKVEEARAETVVIPIQTMTGTFRCRFCQGRTNDPLGHESCRGAA